MLPSVRFSSVTKIVLKNWPPKWDVDKNIKQNALDQFNLYVSNYLDSLEKQHASDPEYKVSAFTLRTSNSKSHVRPEILVIDNDSSPDRDTFIKDEHEEKERILSLAQKQLLSGLSDIFDYDALINDTTTPSPKVFDWNAAKSKLWYYMKDFLDIAHTNVIRRYDNKVTKTIEVDGGLPVKQ